MARKTVYFVIDCSGSMRGNRGDAVNMAMEKVAQEVVPEIKASKNADLELTFKFLGFNSVHPNQVFTLMPDCDVDNFTSWNPIPPETFNGGTPTGVALKMVADDITGANFGDAPRDAVAPAIILISDGLPNTGTPSYEEMIECTDKTSPKCIPQFRKALRITLAMDVDDVGRESLKKFGKVSRRMEAEGIESYYDCTGDYAANFAEILKSVTLNVSVG